MAISPSTSGSATPKVRPVGVTVLAMLEGILSAVLLLGGVALLIAGPLIAVFAPFTVPFFAGVFLTFLGVVLTILGIVGFIVVWGMWSGREWAWWLTTIFAGIGVLIGLATLPGGFFGLILNGAVLYYFTRPHAKEYFGRKPVTLTI